MGSLIRHARWHLVATPPIFPLAVAMIEPTLGAPLVTPIGATALLTPRLFPTPGAAIAVPAITGNADEKHCVTIATYPMPKNYSVLSRRHAPSQAELDNGNRFVAG